MDILKNKIMIPDKYIGLSKEVFYNKVVETAKEDWMFSSNMQNARDVGLNRPGLIMLSHAAFCLIGLVCNESLPHTKYGIKPNPFNYQEAPGALLSEMYAEDKDLWLPLAIKLEQDEPAWFNGKQYKMIEPNKWIELSVNIYTDKDLGFN